MISNYTELKTQVANFMDRSDLDTHIPTFIQLAEARLNRVLRLRAMEKQATAVTTAGQKSLALPHDYIQMRNFQVNVQPITPMSYVTPEIYDRLYVAESNGIPQFYTIVANELHFGPVPEGQTVEMLYYGYFEKLSDSNNTNWLIENAPDLYLYASLMEAEAFIMNDARIPLWAKALAEGVSNLQSQDDRDRHSGSAMRVLNASGYP